MRIYEETTVGGTKPENLVVILEKKEAQMLVNLVSAIAEMKPKDTTESKHRSAARKLEKQLQHLTCF